MKRSLLDSKASPDNFLQEIADLKARIQRLENYPPPAGSTIDHNDTGSIQGGAADEYYHLDASGYASLSGGGSAINHNGLAGLQGGATAEYYHLTATEYPVLPLITALTSAAWADDAKTSADDGVIDLSVIFGAPAGIKTAHVVLWIADGTPGVACRMGPNSGQTFFGQYTQVANLRAIAAGWVPCDANGDIYVVFTGDIDHVWLYITAYCI